MGERKRATNYEVLLVAINSRYTHSNPAVYSLKAYAEQAGHSVAVAEYNINQPVLEILKDIIGKNCQWIGFSCYIWNITIVENLTKQLKLIFPNLNIFWGGPELSGTGPDWLQKVPEIDFLIQGEGEKAFLTLLLAQNGDYANVPNLIWRQSGAIVINAMGEYLDLAELPFYYREEELQQLKNRIIYYESSRGCPFHCHFCISAREKVRYRPLELVKQDLWKLRNSGCKKIKFVDRTFNSDKKRAVAILQYLLEIYREDLCFHIEIEPGCLDETLITLLNTAPPGYIQAEAGVQSLHLPTLESIGRRHLSEGAIENIQKLLQKNNLHLHLDLIAGLPYEGIQELKQSFAGLHRLWPHYLQLGFLKILPGSILAETAAEYDLIYQKTPPYQVLQTPWLSFEEMAKVMDVEYAVDHYYNEEYFKTALQRATTLWQQQGRAVFDFYLALSNYDRQQAGQKSLTQRAEILYQFLSREWPEHTLFWRYSIRLDFIRRGIALPVSLHEKQELDLWKQYQERIAICFPALQEIPKRLWRKQISLFALPVAVAQYTPGVYAANFLQREGLWQQAKILKIAD